MTVPVSAQLGHALWTCVDLSVPQLTRMARREAVVLGAKLAPNWGCFSGVDAQVDPAENSGLHPGLQKGVVAEDQVPGKETGLHPGLQQAMEGDGSHTDALESNEDNDETGLHPGLQESMSAQQAPLQSELPTPTERPTELPTKLPTAKAFRFDADASLSVVTWKDTPSHADANGCGTWKIVYVNALGNRNLAAANGVTDWIKRQRASIAVVVGIVPESNGNDKLIRDELGVHLAATGFNSSRVMRTRSHEFIAVLANAPIELLAEYTASPFKHGCMNARVGRLVLFACRFNDEDAALRSQEARLIASGLAIVDDTSHTAADPGAESAVPIAVIGDLSSLSPLDRKVLAAQSTRSKLKAADQSKFHPLELLTPEGDVSYLAIQELLGAGLHDMCLGTEADEVTVSAGQSLIHPSGCGPTKAFQPPLQTLSLRLDYVLANSVFKDMFRFCKVIDHDDDPAADVRFPLYCESEKVCSGHGDHSHGSGQGQPVPTAASSSLKAPSGRSGELPETEKLRAALAVTTSLRATLLKEYEAESVLTQSMWRDEHTADLLSDRFHRAYHRQNRTFVISVAGMSNTAGHDNFFNSSWPIVMAELLKPVFHALDITLVVRNHAIGGTFSLPYSWCLPTFLGQDSDLVMWEFMMGSEGYGDFKLPSDELFIRNAMSMREHPRVMFNMMGSPRKDEEDGKRIELEARSAASRPEFWQDPQRRRLMEHYLPYGFHALDIEQGIWDQDHHSPFTFSDMWLKKDFPGGAPWHPGVTGHRLQASALVYFYAYAMSKMIQAELDHPHSRSDWAHSHGATVAFNLPAPLSCGHGLPGLWCDLGNAQCATSYEPKVGKAAGGAGNAGDLKDVIAGATAWTHVIAPADAPELREHHADERG
jgi:hypothetical protein